MTQITFGGWENSGNNWTATGNAADGSSGSGRTFLMTGNNKHRARQTGNVERVEFKTSSTTTDGFTCNLVVYRQPTGGSSTAVKVETSEDIVVPGGANAIIDHTFVLPVPVQNGDILGMFIQDRTGIANGFAYTNTEPEAGVLQYFVGSPADDSSQEGAFTPGLLAMRVYTTAPAFAVTGDSMVEGHHNGAIASGLRWHSFLDPSNNFGGIQTSEPAYHIQRALGLDEFTYQNHSLGGESWSWVASTGAPSAIAAQPSNIWVHVGLNDIIAGRSWSDIVQHLNTVRSLVPRSTGLFLSEILPATGLDDTEAATLRSVNAQYLRWCQDNGATLVPTFEGMGQLRSSSGMNDDLIPAYNFDNYHLKTAGVRAFAELVARAVAGSLPTPVRSSISSVDVLGRRVHSVANATQRGVGV